MEVARKKHALSAAYRSYCCMRNRTTRSDSTRSVIASVTSVRDDRFPQNDPAPTFCADGLLLSFAYLSMAAVDPDSCGAAANAESRVDGHSRDQCPVCSTYAAESERSKRIRSRFRKPEVTFVLASSCNQIVREMNGVETPSYQKCPGRHGAQRLLHAHEESIHM
jgi:hypothetical protein